MKRIQQVYKLANKVMPALPYHNSKHALDVCAAVNRLAVRENVSVKDRELLSTAALLHDAVYVVGARDNEEQSVRVACQYLPSFGYAEEEITVIAKLIMATKLPTHPKSLYEKLMCDADLDNLGREDFFAKGEALRQEYGLPAGHAWYAKQLSFVKQHTYYTDAAKKLRNEGLGQNILALERLVNECEATSTR